MTTSTHDREFHPYAAIFELMEGPRLDELCESIRKNGLLHPILLHPDGRIVDGRNRFIACKRVGVEPRFETWNGQGSLVDRIMADNRHRRHDSEAVRSLQAARALPYSQEEARERMAAGGRGGLGKGSGAEGVASAPPLPRKARDDVARAFGVSPRSVQNAKRVLTSGTPELVAAVRSGAVKLSPAADVATLSAERQREVVEAGPAAVQAEAAKVARQRKVRQSAIDALAEVEARRTAAPEPAAQAQASEPTGPAPAPAPQPPAVALDERTALLLAKARKLAPPARLPRDDGRFAVRVYCRDSKRQRYLVRAVYLGTRPAAERVYTGREKADAAADAVWQSYLSRDGWPEPAPDAPRPKRNPAGGRRPRSEMDAAANEGAVGQE